MDELHMRPADRQKGHERFLLERFLEAANLTAEIIEEREAPDFIVRADSRLVGIEVTELFIPQRDGRPLKQEQESLAMRIVTRAQEMCRASGGPAVHVMLVFSGGVDFRKIGRHKAAKRLVAFVHKLNLSEGENFTSRAADDDDALPAEISYLQVLGVPSQPSCNSRSWRPASRPNRPWA